MEQSSNFPLVRRAKPVESRPVDPAAVAAAPPPLIEAPSAPVLIEPQESEPLPVVDPTTYSQRRRKRRHEKLLQLSRFLIAGSFVATLAAIVCLVLGDDRFVANALTSLAISIGIAAIFISWPTRLSARVLGYAVASTVLASICFAAFSLLPKDLFDDHRPDVYKDDGARPVHRAVPAQE